MSAAMPHAGTGEGRHSAQIACTVHACTHQICDYGIGQSRRPPRPGAPGRPAGHRTLPARHPHAGSAASNEKSTVPPPRGRARRSRHRDAPLRARNTLLADSLHPGSPNGSRGPVISRGPSAPELRRARFRTVSLPKGFPAEGRCPVRPCRAATASLRLDPAGSRGRVPGHGVAGTLSILDQLCGCQSAGSCCYLILSAYCGMLTFAGWSP